MYIVLQMNFINEKKKKNLKILLIDNNKALAMVLRCINLFSLDVNEKIYPFIYFF